MIAILVLGFLVGMRHALEADHVAAVSSIASDQTRLREAVQHGLTWGLGHTITLFLFAGAAILLGRAIPAGVQSGLEMAVGFMLVGLGTNVLWRLWRDRVHFHPHRHDNGLTHLHAHGHAGEDAPHAHASHEHEHTFRWRTLVVGLMHGMAGSAALLVLAATQLAGAAQGIMYVLVFGVGSMVGMGLLSSVIAVPFAMSARFLTWSNRWLQAVVGTTTIAIGLMTILRSSLP